MSAVLIGIVVVVVLLAAWLFLQTVRNLGREQESRARIEQLQRDLQTLAGQTQNFSQQLGQLAQNVTKSLEGVTGALQRGVTDSATIAAQAQTAMASELKNSRETLGQIQQQLGAVQQAGHQMSQTAQTLQNILGGAKSRGSLGEVALERLLEDALPRERYQAIPFFQRRGRGCRHLSPRQIIAHRLEIPPRRLSPHQRAKRGASIPAGG